jgi:hypothetical protein
VERYRFALDILSRQDARLRALAQRVEALDAASADSLLGDVLLRAELETALGRSSSSLEPSRAALCWLLEQGLASCEGERPPGIARRAMEREFLLGPAQRAWVWDMPERSSAVLDRLRDAIRTGFMPGAESSVDIIRPSPRMVAGLARACSLLCRLVPHMAASALQGSGAVGRATHHRTLR